MAFPEWLGRCHHVLLVVAAATACTPFKVDPSDAGARCSHQAPPARPTVMNAGASLPDFELAISGYRNNAPDDAGTRSYRVVGFDLDDTCTGEGQGNSCVEPSWATADHTDGVDGIDNAVGQVLPSAGATTRSTPTMVFRVASYSGAPDDDQVEVSLYAAFGLAPRGDAGDGDGGVDPVWDGNDRWKILPEVLVPSASPSVDEPLYRDDHAYVSHGTLVANFPHAFWSPGNPLEPFELLPANQITLAGQLTRVGGQWTLQNGVVDMRIRFNDILTGFAEGLVPNQDAGRITCQDMAQYRTVRESICPFVDIASVPGPTSAPCDALSSAAWFQALQALLGDVRPPSPPLSLMCAPGIDPTTDTCETGD